MKVTRREAIKAGLTVAGAAAVGCGDGEVPGTDVDAGIVGAPDAAPPATPDAAPPDEPDASVVVDASPPAPDAAPPPTPAELLASIDTIVVLMMENRSFDHMLGARSLLEGKPVDGLLPTMKNPDPDGLDVYVHQLADFRPDDPPHAWDPVHAQWNGGAMDGFVKVHAGPSQADVMGYHVREQLPVTWGLADAFTTCDRWFCSVLGPTWPNRFYLHGGTSNGTKGNLPALGFKSIFAALDAAGISHKNYFADIAWAAGGYLKLGGNAGIEQFLADAAAGTLPAFSIVDPAFFGAGANDDHPDHDVRLGQAFIGTLYAALRASPQWDRMLFVVTYDEHGGFFDHVPPPEMASDERSEFRRLGVRVPGLVAGGTVRRGQTVSTLFDHVSVVATVTRRFGLAPLNARVAATSDLSSCIDPALLGNPQPGPAMPAPPPISMASLRALDARLRGVRPTHHVELWDAAESGRIPPHLDRRADGLRIAEHWLREGARLGAVTLT